MAISFYINEKNTFDTISQWQDVLINVLRCLRNQMFFVNSWPSVFSRHTIAVFKRSFACQICSE